MGVLSSLGIHKYLLIQRRWVNLIDYFCAGASGESVDLLPSPSEADWTKNLPTDDGHVMDQIFSFDGQSNAVEVPAGHFDHQLGDHFTISMWMKHDFPEGGPVNVHHSGPKEHVLCMSDGDGRLEENVLVVLLF